VYLDDDTELALSIPTVLKTIFVAVGAIEVVDCIWLAVKSLFCVLELSTMSLDQPRIGILIPVKPK
jgi:hypothetical protein